MPRRLAYSQPSDDSSDLDDDTLRLCHYEALRLAEALGRGGDDLTAATHELALALPLAARSGKPVAAAAAADAERALDAYEACGAWTARQRRALDALAAAAARWLPRQRAQRFARRHRELAISRARGGRRGGGEPAPAAPGGAYAGLPPEVLGLVFWHLNPDDLAAAAAVCRAWRPTALADAVWALQLPRLSGYPPPGGWAAEAAAGAPARRHFAAAVARCPRPAALPWRTNRALDRSAGRPLWLPSGAGDGCAGRWRTMSPWYPRLAPEQAVRWAATGGRTHRASSSSSSSDDSDEEIDPVFGSFWRRAFETLGLQAPAAAAAADAADG